MFILGDDFEVEFTLDEFLEILENDMLDEVIEEILEEEEKKNKENSKQELSKDDDDIDIQDIFDLFEKELMDLMLPSFASVAIVDNDTLDAIFIKKKRAKHPKIGEDEEDKLTPEDRKVIRILNRFAW